MSCYRRIACLSTEAVETLYALGADELIAGISGFAVRPPRARTEKPKISGFSSSRLERILAVKPDLVIGFSDMQADICRELAAAGIEVHLFNQRDIAGILRMVRVLAALVERWDAGEQLVASLQAVTASIMERAGKTEAAAGGMRPRVYFEEWNDPMISGIGWVSEMISLAGGDDIFADLAAHGSARERIIADPAEVIRRAPDIIIGSWCGKKFRAETVCGRHGWQAIPAVRNGMVFEIKSADILSPGPSAITEGLPQMADIIRRWHQTQS